MAGLVAIVGPTATGKSALALHLAESIGGEIINADSRQVYRYMDIGTAKPPPHDLDRVPHHLYDLVDPDEPFNLALYLQQANLAVDDIYSRNRVPILVGGSGLYVWGFLEGMSIPHVPPNPDLRARLEEEAATLGPQVLHDRLNAVDPDAAANIDARNIRRVVRALEVYEVSGVPFSKQVQKKGLDYPILIIGLNGPRDTLHLRTDSRVDSMIESGFVEEVSDILGRGYGLGLPSMSGVGYKQLGSYLNGESTLEAAVEKTKTETHRLIRHQAAWFKPKDPRIDWYDISEDFTASVTERVSEFVSETQI